MYFVWDEVLNTDILRINLLWEENRTQKTSYVPTLQNLTKNSSMVSNLLPLKIDYGFAKMTGCRGDDSRLLAVAGGDIQE